jgi:hypothetical protein
MAAPLPVAMIVRDRKASPGTRYASPLCFRRNVNRCFTLGTGRTVAEGMAARLTWTASATFSGGGLLPIRC